MTIVLAELKPKKAYKEKIKAVEDRNNAKMMSAVISVSMKKLHRYQEQVNLFQVQFMMYCI